MRKITVEPTTEMFSNQKNANTVYDIISKEVHLAIRIFLKKKLGLLCRNSE
jgi:hypothetical protein